MAWTQNRGRGRGPYRRHCPGLEALDDRCLLSTSAGTAALHHSLIPHRLAGVHARSAQTAVLDQHGSARFPSAWVSAVQAAQPSVQPERPAGTVTTGVPTAFDPIVGAAAARSAYGVTGAGMAVAVIDTGVDYKNAAFGGAFGPGAKVIAGYNFATNTPDPMATTSQHGTAVAGLIGSSDPNHLGVAPGVNIIALKVVGDNNTADLSNIARALQWVIDNHSQYHITAVNMSLSDGGNYAHNWFAQDGGVGQRITDLIGQLKSLSIPVVAATGNSFQGQQGEGFTSIVGDVISVTATDTADHLLPAAQRLGSTIGMGTATDLAAPGAGFVAPSGDNQLANVDGTSFATPLVTGSVVLLQQIYESRFGTLPTVDQVTGWLEHGSDPIHDPVTGITIGRLDIPKAASLIPAASTGSTSATAAGSVATDVSPSQSGTWIANTANPTPVSYVPSTPPQASTPSPPASQTPAPTPPRAPAPSPAPTPAPTTAAQVLVNPAPVAPVPSHSNTGSTPAPIQAATPAEVRVFVDGKPLSSLSPTQPSPVRSISQNRFDSLVKAMSAWAMSTGDHQSGPDASSQVRIWNAPTQAAGSLGTGTAYPAGHLAVRMSRTRHPRHVK
jgi:subtilisin family serine protease